LPARGPVKRKQRRQVRPLRQQARPAGTTGGDQAQPGEAMQAQATTPRAAPVSATRMALQARAAELARLEAVYLRHDLRNIALIAGLMLAIVIGLSFALH